MENKIQVLFEEIKQIHAQYVDEVGPGDRKAWPRAIKSRVLELDRMINSTKRTAEVCGLSVDTIYQWRAEVKKANFKQLSVVSRFITVTVTTPKGYKVAGLSVFTVFVCIR